MTQGAAKLSVPRKRGRPRRLDLERIVDAALDMGLGNLEMNALAERLGVGIGTLYGYVSSRQELINLAMSRTISQPLVKDYGQTWQEAVREMAAASFNSFTSDRQMLVEFTRGTYDSTVGDAYQASMVAFLASRGFDEEAANNLYCEVNQTVLGASFGYLHKLDHPELAGSLPTMMGEYRRSLEWIVADYEKSVP